MENQLRRVVITAVCALILSLGYASPAAAQVTADFSKPLLLAATPELGGLYSRSVLIAVPLGDVHVGFILNHATKVKMKQAFPDHAPSEKIVDPIYLGGPERPQGLFALLRRNPGKPSFHLFDDLFLATDRMVIDQIIEQTPNDARYFVGFVSWRPGELASEVEKGYWYALDADVDAVFQKPSEGIWAEGMWEEFTQKIKMKENGI